MEIARQGISVAPSTTPPTTSLFPSAPFESFRRQESMLILLNLGIISFLVATQWFYQAVLGPPGQLVLFLFGLRFLMQTLEFLGLVLGSRISSLFHRHGYAHFSIFAHVLFGAAVAILSNKENSHYSVLMVLPIAAAAFRYPLPGTLGVAGISGAVTVLEIWVFSRGSDTPPFSEYFEASTTVLIYLVVALITWLLVQQVTHEKDQLESTLGELRETRDRLVDEAKLAAVGRLAGGVAHEIRNPIAMISSSLKTASRPGIRQELREELFQIAQSEATRLEHFTGDFLSYARIQEPRKSATPVAAVVEYVVGVCKSQAAAAGVEVHADCVAADLACVDAFQIQRAVLNLVINAIEATPAGGSVEAGCRIDGNGDVFFFVENSGPAIDEETAQRIFEPFFTTKGKGTGLGLAIAANITKSHDGRLDLAVNRRGQVRFVIHLPGAALERKIAEGESCPES